MGTPLFWGGGHWARLHYQTEISSRKAFHDSAVAGVDWQETGKARNRNEFNSSLFKIRRHRFN